jgi:hypothetical protein
LRTCDEPSKSESELSDVALADFESNASLEVTQPLVSTTRLGLQRSKGRINTYVPGTVPERLYKRAQLAHETLDGAYQLTPDVFAPTAAELRAVAAEVSDEALTKAITALKETVVSSRSGRRGAPTRKVILNEVQMQGGFSEQVSQDSIS